MSVQSALLPHPLLSLLLLILWLLLNDSLAPGHILLGSFLGFAIALFSKQFWPQTASFKRPLLALRFAALVIYDIVVANFAVARTVLGRRSAIRPAFVPVPLDVRGDFAVTVLLSVISITPGTLSAELRPDRRHVLVHALNEKDPAALARHIKTRYEAPIKEIFKC